MKKQLTKKEWAEFVSKNCDNSYSLAVCLAIMNLWENPEDNLHGYGLSGAQAEMAIDFVKKHEYNVTNLQGNPIMEEREDLSPNQA
jgi:hypothetical protein